MKLCFPCASFLLEKNFKKHLHTKTRLVNNGKRWFVISVKVYKSLYEAQNKKVHRQSQKCILKNSKHCSKSVKLF